MVNLGVRIRKLRLQQARTLRDIADGCGFTGSLLSKIETGKTVPPVSTLLKIADTLGVKVSTLLDEAEDHGAIHNKAMQVEDRLTRTGKGSAFVAFAGERPDKAFQPFLFEVRRDEIKSQAASHRGEEFLYMLDGEMRCRVDSVEYILRPGDSLYFDSENEHDLTLLSETVRYLAVFSEREKKQ